MSGNDTTQVNNPAIIAGPTDFTLLPKQYDAFLIKGSTTPTVANINEWTARNTVPVLITNFTNGQNGQTIRILGDGFTSVKNGTKIVTNTAADKLLALNSVYTFTKRAGVWYEQSDVVGSGGGGGGGVTSIYGRAGIVVATLGDYTLALVPAVVVTKVANYVLTAADYFVRGDASGGAIVLTLPTAASLTGRVFIIKRINAGANTVTVQANGAELIDGANTAVLSVQYESITVISNGVSWDIV